MNFVLYSVKRIFHRSIALGKRLLTGLCLTPARFDMLHLIFIKGHEMRQSDVRRVLGVTAPTVSRMLGSLELLGFVLRARPAQGDRRQRDVRLTQEGIECIRRAMRAMYATDVARIAVDEVFLAHGDSYEDEHLEEASELNAQLFHIRARIGDRGRLHHLPFGYG